MVQLVRGAAGFLMNSIEEGTQESKLGTFRKYLADKVTEDGYRAANYENGDPFLRNPEKINGELDFITAYIECTGDRNINLDGSSSDQKPFQDLYDRVHKETGARDNEYRIIDMAFGTISPGASDFRNMMYGAGIGFFQGFIYYQNVIPAVVTGAVYGAALMSIDLAITKGMTNRRMAGCSLAGYLFGTLIDSVNSYHGTPAMNTYGMIFSGIGAAIGANRDSHDTKEYLREIAPPGKTKEECYRMADERLRERINQMELNIH